MSESADSLSSSEDETCWSNSCKDTVEDSKNRRPTAIDPVKTESKTKRNKLVPTKQYDD